MSNKKNSNHLKNNIKKVIEFALKTNANSTGCFVIYQPKVPKSIIKYKKNSD